MNETLGAMADGLSPAKILGASVRNWHVLRGSPPLKDSAAEIGVSTSTIHKVMNDGDLRMSTGAQVIAGIGGDFLLAIPNYLLPDDLAEVEQTRLQGVGEIEAEYARHDDDKVVMAGEVFGRDATVEWLRSADRPIVPGLKLGEIASKELSLLTIGPGLLLRLRDAAGSFPAGASLVARECKTGFEPPRRAINAIISSGGAPSKLRRVAWHAGQTVAWMPGTDMAAPDLIEERTICFQAIVLGALIPG